MSTLPPDARGVRMDHAIHRLMHALGREASVREIREALRQGKITVDGRVARPGRPALGGERIETIGFVSRREAVLAPAAADVLKGVAVVARDPDVLVLDKPAGLPTHPLSPHDRRTLLNVAVALCPEVGEAGPPLEGGLLHRLDTGTSGVVLFATRRRDRDRLRRDFAERRVHKTYLALTVPPAWASKRADGRIAGRGPSVRVLAASDPEGLVAETNLRVVRRAADRAWVVAETTTGRRHQVRAHLSALGAPLWGDARYGGPPAPRLGLHASEVRLPDGRAFAAPLPPDLTELLEPP